MQALTAFNGRDWIERHRAVAASDFITLVVDRFHGFLEARTCKRCKPVAPPPAR